MLFDLTLPALAADVLPAGRACSCTGVTFLGFSLSTLLLLGLVIYAVVKLLRRRRKDMRVQKQERTELERWIDEALSRELSRKLDLERDVISRALDGTPEPDVVGSIEEAVKAVQVKYARTADGGVEARLEISFEDGSSATATRTVSAGDVPRSILDEFARTGGAFVFRPVHFPWSGLA
ncbi:MAG: hypothetical protein IT372_19095 [Polyangiaceae bacterium]|nr:hypothetical protein [Polyangiaceae bacterium]